MQGIQLSIDDVDGVSPGSMERLGESVAYGYALLNLMSLSGWDVAVTTPFAGLDETGEHPAGVLILAARGGLELRRTGESVAELAPELFGEAMRLMGRVNA